MTGISYHKPSISYFKAGSFTASLYALERLPQPEVEPTAAAFAQPQRVI
jgi:hypothetical protein